MPNAFGIDVAVYQGKIDWATTLAHLGPEPWVAMKATLGVGNIDPTFATNRAGAAKAKFRLLYHWITPAGPVARMTAAGRAKDAREQAAWFLQTVGKLADGEGVLLDAEQAGIREDQVLVWCQTVEAATRRPVAVYTGKYVAGGEIWNSTAIFDGRRPRVFAAYIPEEQARAAAQPFGFDVWQWTSSGNTPGGPPIPGVAARVDIDHIEHPRAFDAVCYPPAPPKPPAPPAPPTITTKDDLMDLINKPAVFSADVNPGTTFVPLPITAAKAYKVVEVGVRVNAATSGHLQSDGGCWVAGFDPGTTPTVSTAMVPVVAQGNLLGVNIESSVPAHLVVDLHAAWA